MTLKDQINGYDPSVREGHPQALAQSFGKGRWYLGHDPLVRECDSCFLFFVREPEDCDSHNMSSLPSKLRRVAQVKDNDKVKLKKVKRLRPKIKLRIRK